MKELRLPTGCTLLAEDEQERTQGGSVSGFFLSAAKALYPEEKVAGMSRGGYTPTVILVPDASPLDYAALWTAKVMYRVSGWFGGLGI